MVYQAFESCMESKIRKGKHCAMLIDTSSLEQKHVYINKRLPNNHVHHAEEGLMDTLYQVNDQLDVKECFVFVCRANLIGEMKYSKPCENCQLKMKENGIHVCVYSSGHFKFEILHL